MRLLFAPRSPFARKVRIVVHELGLLGAVRPEIVDPWTDDAVRGVNPLCKVPTLVLDDGSSLYDSPVICEYLNDMAAGPLLARSGATRWDALRRQALGDGLAEAVIRRHVETLDAPNSRRLSVIERQEAAIAAALDACETRASTPHTGRFDLGDIAVVAALGYFRFRSPELAETLLGARTRGWLAELDERPSCFATRIVPAAGP